VENRERYLAEQFILHTSRSVFLTGKAGTGKTTLLKEIITKSTKRTAVVAPTGVAAVNAKGVTIHSFFQLPTTTFAPTHDYLTIENITNRRVLAQKQKLRQEKRQVLIELQLLVIDEISMVRADLLDAIDFTLRRIRKIPLPFGGVQLLVIGDLFQLAPIIKPHEWNALKAYYNSPFFFESIAWKECGAIQIELQKVYRQADEMFINVLNRIRNGISHGNDVEMLNQRYQESVKTDEVITLTTHNRKADAINVKELDRLSGKKVKMKAKVTGKFSESAYPTKAELILKKGAQVMFVKNHSDGLYYNGKLGTIESIDSDKIKVHLIEDDFSIDVVEEQWKNTKYTVDAETKNIEQEEVGTFQQYPFRLAWAITVHKSQGLTFEDVILDLENTFAPGQLYVALSRCRSLEGIRLSSKIRSQNIIVDQRVSEFYNAMRLDDGIQEELAQSKDLYARQLLLSSFSMKKLLAYAEAWETFMLDFDIPSQADALLQAKQAFGVLDRLDATAEKFKIQLHDLEREGVNISIIRDRYAKAIDYFTNELYHKLIVGLEKHASIWKKRSGSKKYNQITQDLIDECWRHVQQLYTLEMNGVALYQGSEQYKQVILFDPDRKKKKVKRVVGETYTITHKLMQEGLSIGEIAKERKLSIGTIEVHMGKLIKDNKIKITSLLPESRIKQLKEALGSRLDEPSNEIMQSLDFDVSYAEIRWIKNWLSKEE